MSTNEPHSDFSQFEAYTIRALQELLAGRIPNAEETTHLTGDVRACIDALRHALQTDGVVAVRQAFTALAKDRPWLMKLVVQQPPSDELGHEEQAEQPPTRRIRFLPTSDFLNRPPQQWLIPCILPKDGIAMLYGLSGTYKSFLTMGGSLSIATGLPWLGRHVMRGYVAYICAEGSYGIGKRVKAWMAHHAYTNVDDIALKWFDETLVLQDAQHLIELLTALEEDFAEPPVMVVIDTLSRCSAGADENSNTEMAKLLAVTPTMVGCTVSSVKPKDAPKFDDIHLATHVVSYGPSEEDASLVLISTTKKAAKPALSKAEATMYALLAGNELSYGEWVKAGMDDRLGDAKLSERTAQDAITRLKEAGRVQQAGKRGLYSVVSEQEDTEEM